MAPTLLRRNDPSVLQLIHLLPHAVWRTLKIMIFGCIVLACLVAIIYATVGLFFLLVYLMTQWPVYIYQAKRHYVAWQERRRQRKEAKEQAELELLNVHEPGGLVPEGDDGHRESVSGETLYDGEEDGKEDGKEMV